MTTDISLQAFWAKALENIDSAGSELTNRRYNASANRAYYAVFQAAIVALLRARIGGTGSYRPYLPASLLCGARSIRRCFEMPCRVWRSLGNAQTMPSRTSAGLRPSVRSDAPAHS